MRKKIFSILAIVLSCLLIYSLYTYWPQKHSLTLPVIMIQHGENNKDYELKTTLRLDGTYNNNLFKPHTFKGKIEVDGESFFEKYNPFTLNFDHHNLTAVIIYMDNDRGSIVHETYGTMYINKAFNEIVITKLIEDENNNNNKSWSGADGYTLAAPATTREEAIQKINAVFNGTTIQ